MAVSATDSAPPPTLPRMLRRAWRQSDPASRCERVCDALGRATVHQKLSTREGSYWICGETGQMTRDSFELQNAELYDRWWATQMLPEKAAVEQVHKRRHWLEKFSRYRQTGRLLEVGSGQGLLLRAALELGWKAEGNEISPLAAESLRKATGATVHLGAIERVALERGVFDVVVCDNVFEHLEQPMAVLRSLAEALRPGGAIYLQTVSAQSLSIWAGPHDFCYYAKGHNFLPTLVSLKHYFAACGLEAKRLRTHGFRSAARTRRNGAGRWRKSLDKAIATAAAAMNLGHRVEVLLERRAG